MTQSNFEIGAEFENAVAILLKSAGYRVLQNRVLNGQEIDIIAENNNLIIGTQRIILECKHKKTGSVSNQQVMDFLNVCRHLHASGDGDSFIMVTNSKFSSQSYDVAKSFPKLRLYSFDELEENLTGLREGMRKWTTEFQRTSEFERFIPLSGEFSKQTSRQDTTCNREILPYLLESLTDPSERNFIFLLGDFGSGKTTVARRVFCELCQRYYEQGGNWVPLLLPLKTLLASRDLESFVLTQVAETYKSNLLLDRIWKRILNSGAISVLDGFDEIKTHSSKEDRERSFARILEVASISKHVLLTSRPGHFNSYSEIFDISNSIGGKVRQRPQSNDLRESRKSAAKKEIYEQTLRRLSGSYRRKIEGIDRFDCVEMIDVAPLGERDIEKYLSRFDSEFQKQFSRDHVFILNRLKGIYDLTDLLTRPILLDMIVFVLLNSGIDIRDEDLEIGPAGIYSLYVNTSLERDYEVGESRQFLNKEQRWFLCQLIARAIFEQNRGMNIDSEVMLNTIQNTLHDESYSTIFAALRSFPIEHIVTDLRTSSFLTIFGDDSISFVHKSFYEFFLASFLKENFKEKNVEKLIDNPLSPEVIYFLGSFALLEDTFRVDVERALRHRREIKGPVRNNLLNLVAVMELLSKQRNFHDACLDRVRLKDKVFDDCQMAQTVFKDCVIKDTSFTQCERLATEFIGGSLDGLSFNESSGSARFEVSSASISIDACNDLALNFSCHGGSLAINDTKNISFQNRGTIEFVEIESSENAIIENHGHIEKIVLRELDFPIYEDVGELAETASLLIDNCRNFFLRLSRHASTTFINNVDKGYGRGIAVVRDPRGEHSIFLEKNDDGKGVRARRKWAVIGDCLIIEESAGDELVKELSQKWFAGMFPVHLGSYFG